jgi:hypothetical protein
MSIAAVPVLTAKQRLRALLRSVAQKPLIVRLHYGWWTTRPRWRQITQANPVAQAHAGQTRRILAYCPDTFVREHFISMQTIARLLQRAGHEVLLGHCRGIFDRCMPKDSVPGEAPAVRGQAICISCIRSRFALLDPADFDGFSLSDAITPAIREKARDLVDALGDNDLTQFSLDGVKLGVACLHDLMLSRKLMTDSRLEPGHYLYLRQYLTSVIATYLGMKDYLPRAGFTDILIYGQYAANVALICAARAAGVNWRMIGNVNHLGVDRGRFYIYGAQTHFWLSQMIDQWPEWRDRTMAEGEIEETGDDVLTRFGAKSYTTYSPAKTRDDDVFAALKLDPTRKLVVAFTSSLDEFHAEAFVDEVLGFPVATPERPYHDQITWLKSIAMEVAKRDDLQLVIRIHPREDANKREGARSKHLEMLREHLSNLPPHVTVVWPTDPISSYNLMEVADLVQVWTSTVGLESARLGVPLVKIFRRYESYPEGDFALSAPTHEGVVAAMNTALSWPSDLDRLIKAWRYYGYSRFAASIDLRDVVPPAGAPGLPPYRPAARAQELARAVFDGAAPWIINRESRAFIDSRLPDGREAMLVKRQLRRIIYAIFTGEWPAADVPFALVEDGTLEKCAPDGTFAAKGARCSYAWKGQVYIRYSPLCARLAAMLAHDNALAPAELFD